MNTPARLGLRPAGLAALGIVYGGIGTSPLYAFREAFDPVRGLAATQSNVYAVLSMIFWAMTLVVSLKYVTVMLRFDNRGEGGVLALLSWCLNVLRDQPRAGATATLIGAGAVSLFYGDAVITPAISVLSAVEGLALAVPHFEPLVLPITLAVLAALFLVQGRGTSGLTGVFGAVMFAWFAAIGALGALSLAHTPEVLAALDPRHALGLVVHHPGLAFIAAGAVFLTITGVETLYADLGQVGAKPMRLAWFAFALPALTLNYFGQGALVLREPQAAHPFFLLAPPDMLLPLVGLAVLAAIVASQAVISGAFSATQQASRLNFLPRLRVLRTSDRGQGELYIPVVNWLLLLAVVLLVLAFRDSGSLAAAYGIAVSGDLLLASVLMLVSLPYLQSRMRWLWLPFLGFAVLEFAFFLANIARVTSGGWFPLALALLVFTIFTTWRRGLEVVRARKDAGPKRTLDCLSIDLSGVPRVPGAAVFLSSSRTGCPSAFLHNLKHNGIVHQTTIFLNVEFEDVPRVPESERVQLMRGTNGIVRVSAHLGFREDPDIHGILREAARKGLVCKVDETSFFTSKPTVVSVSRRGAFGWRRSLFGWMLQNSPSVASYFRLPPNRVIELGTQVGI
jgi:KUP system potassium uptake protein